MGGLLLLLALSAVMAFASFLAGALPLSMTLSQSQLRLVSSIGVGILVGTSLIVIIPEGVEAIAATVLNPSSGTAAPAGSANVARHLNRCSLALPPTTIAVRSPAPANPAAAGALSDTIAALLPRGDDDSTLAARNTEFDRSRSALKWATTKKDEEDAEIAAAAAAAAAEEEAAAKKEKEEVAAPGDTDTQGVGATSPKAGDDTAPPDEHGPDEPDDHDHAHGLPTFYIGFALVTGFVCMFLIDRLPRHAVDKLQSAPATRHISLDNLASSHALGGPGDDDESGDLEGEGFLGSLTPTPRQSRGLATTVGLVIHAAADGIAMGASATTEDMKLGLVIFVAIMVHKAPAAFGLTSVLLKHGLSKRAARGHLVVFSLAAPFGALTTYIIIKLIGGNHMEGEKGQWWTGMLLLFSAGTFLYVAMQAMQEESSGHDHHSMLGNGYADSSSTAAARKQNKPQMRDTLATIGGMLLPLLTQFGHHH